LVSVVVGRRQGADLDIVTWLMSCRVIARRLEEFVLDQLVEAAREEGIVSLRARYLPTKKNGIVSEHYARLGFERVEALPDGTTSWQLAIADYEPWSPPIARRVLELES
jgi:predicted enzyme involved in methoxymalonyl-ACP biosynthesis